MLTELVGERAAPTTTARTVPSMITTTVVTVKGVVALTSEGARLTNLCDRAHIGSLCTCAIAHLPDCTAVHQTEQHREKQHEGDDGMRWLEKCHIYLGHYCSRKTHECFEGADDCTCQLCKLTLLFKVVLHLAD